MKHRLLLAMLSLVSLLVMTSCININKIRDLLHLNAKPLTFETYDREIRYPDDSDTKITLKLKVDMPVGGGKEQDRISNGIREIISKSNIAKQFGNPQEGTLTEILDDYVKRLQQSGSTDEYGSYYLTISNVYQNEECAVFNVIDSNSSDENHVFDAVIRKSDGHWMTFEEMLKITKGVLKMLFQQFADDSYAEGINIETEDFCVSPSEDGCVISVGNGDISVTVPLEEMEPYFTDEGRELFQAKPVTIEKVDEAILKANPIKGELGRYNLRGPVKSLDLTDPEIPDIPWIITFDHNGIITSDAGLVPNERVIERDAQGRAIRDGNVEYMYDEEGKLIKSDFREGRYALNVTVRYYNRYGAVVRENTLESVMAGRSFIHYSRRYSNFKYDEHGNWIERKDDNGKVHKRVITYYQNDEEEEAPIKKLVIWGPGHGDLGGYDLRGPVKKVAYDGWSCTFNEKGQLLTENGKSLKSIFPGGVKRDRQGRLVECNADGYGSRYYTYNSQGLPTEIAEDGYNRKFTYDDDGYVKTEEEYIAPDIGDEGDGETIRSTYTILEKDNYGNWTKRKNQRGEVVKRKITYYE